MVNRELELNDGRSLNILRRCSSSKKTSTVRFELAIRGVSLERHLIPKPDWLSSMPAANGQRHEPLRRAGTLQSNQNSNHSTAHPLLFATSSVNSSLLSAGSRIEPLDSSYSDSCYSSEHEVLSREPSDSTQLIDQTTIDLATHCAISGAEELSDSSLREFAAKLGYSDEHLQIALDKLGPNAEQDGVLCELIKLGKKSKNKTNNKRGNTTKITPTVTLSSTSTTTLTERKLRPIVIDGSNIAMTHGRKTTFSCSGIRECVNFFLRRGHTEIFVFVPKFYQETPRPDTPITDQHLLFELENEGILIWTPSRRINGRRMVCHDDRYVLSTAFDKEAVIVSNDEFRDSIRDHPEYKTMIAQRLLMYSFVDGKFVPPEDPLGRHGPKLDRFLEIRPHFGLQICPYARKCTYGNKCKYLHPERNGQHLSVTERLMHQNSHKQTLSARASIGDVPQLRHVLNNVNQNMNYADIHGKITRTHSATAALNNAIQHSNHQYLPPQQPDLLLSIPMTFNSSVSPQHPQLNRHTSAPLNVCNNVMDTSIHHPMTLLSEWPTIGEHRTHSTSTLNQTIPDVNHWNNEVFAPHKSVWSDCSTQPQENFMQSSNPMMSVMEQRERMKHNLCQIFPVSSVVAVLNAHPNETNAQRLCQRILAYQSGFEN
ncbi:C3H1-type domain-containing protein [Aphelenchoides besseyi]|nr:C3H1-type domain-containing protein [Aphelenchoides besseyi]